MTQATDSDFQRLVIERLDKLDQDIRGLSDSLWDGRAERLEKTDIKLDAYVKADDRLREGSKTVIELAGSIGNLSLCCFTIGGRCMRAISAQLL
jgi:hypothetical protein